MPICPASVTAQRIINPIKPLLLNGHNVCARNNILPDDGFCVSLPSPPPPYRLPRSNEGIFFFSLFTLLPIIVTCV